MNDYFNTSHKYGEWALAHEIKRIKYLNDWSYNRGIKFTNVASSLKYRKISPTKRGVRVSLDEIYKFDYEYKSDETPTKNSFGVSIQHTVDLIKKMISGSYLQTGILIVLKMLLNLILLIQIV